MYLTPEEDARLRGIDPLLKPKVRLRTQVLRLSGVWRRLKGFLMPPRFYDSLAELKRAVEIHPQLGGT